MTCRCPGGDCEWLHEKHYEGDHGDTWAYRCLKPGRMARLIASCDRQSKNLVADWCNIDHNRK